MGIKKGGYERRQGGAQNISLKIIPFRVKKRKNVKGERRTNN